MVTNAGGINTATCASLIREMCKKMNLDLTVAEVHGDNLMPCLNEMQENPDNFKGKLNDLTYIACFK